LRNYVHLYAIENDVPLPIGPQNVELLDPRINDEDEELQPSIVSMPDDEGEAGGGRSCVQHGGLGTHEDIRAPGAPGYAEYSARQSHRFRWIRPSLFQDRLAEDLAGDAEALISVLNRAGDWKADQDEKLLALYELLTNRYPDQKVIVFTQFADTVDYLAREL